ncbi:alpha/beta hydrolase [Zhengella mangrovi]|uniref:Alpha/beta hydrolase n=1 Tax=Zhengella mangrovi TaxID=1982044 RepID=A0A2G1QQ91_9HYPH|nr:alpha/beta hydrolase [Zhengella mangrovi]PHP67630.1 alpha/beta hydrolase [Zhengella mangrovi]
MTSAAFPSRTLASPTGATLNLYHREAEGKAVGVVQINHGLAEHAARYARFAGALANAGFHVYAQDHRGHGGTAVANTPARMFAWKDGADKVIADVDMVHDLIEAQHEGLPVIAFGHSMGGLIALNYTMRHAGRLAGAAIWNANFSAGMLGRLARAILAWERFRLGSDAASRILPKLTFQAWNRQFDPARTEFDWLSRDEPEVDKYVTDPQCGWDASISMWQDLFRFIFAGADDTKLQAIPRTLPIHLLGGEKDPATDGGKAVNDLTGRLGRLGFSTVESIVLPETRHESLNEINREEVTRRFIDWARKIAARAG